MPLPRAGMLKVGAFAADAESRARFAAGFFDKPTADSVFGSGSIDSSKIVVAGNIDFGGLYKPTGVIDPIGNQDLVTLGYANSHYLGFVKPDGSVPFTGNQSLGGHDLTNVGNLVLAGATSGTVTLHAPAAAGTQVYTLPTAIGAAGSVLTDSAGDGVLSWQAGGGGGGGGTLDAAYDFGGVGAGRIITVDTGAVHFDKTDSSPTNNGFEVAVLTTTVAAGSNNVALPTGTINVASTAGFASSGKLIVYTSGGPGFVTYTGITGTTFTGCTGGSGKMFTGITVAAGWGVSALFTGAAPSSRGTGPQGATQTEVWGNESQCGGGFSVVLGDFAIVNQTAHFTDGVLIGTNSSTLSAVTSANYNFCTDFVGIGCGAYVGSFGSVIIGSTSSGPNETQELVTLVGCFSSAAGEFTCVYGENARGGTHCITIGMSSDNNSATGSIAMGHSIATTTGGSANNAICIGNSTHANSGGGGDSQYNLFIGTGLTSAAIDGASNHNIWIGHRVTQSAGANILDEASNNVVIGHDMRFALGANTWIHQVQNSVVIGANQVYSTNPNQCVIIGATAVSSATGAVAVGFGATVTGASGVALGSGSTAGASEFSVLNGDFNFKVGAATGVQFGASNAVKMAWFGAPPTAQLTVTGSLGGNAALASLVAQLATYGLIVDGTSA